MRLTKKVIKGTLRMALLLLISAFAHTAVAESTFPLLSTPNDQIPFFCYNPTITSVKSGSWSDPSVWSLGRVPVSTDVVDIATNTLVSYDAAAGASDCVAVNGHLKFRTDINTSLEVANLMVLEGGHLEIGSTTSPIAPDVKAEIIIADEPLDLVNDPKQYGTALIVLGKATMHGAKNVWPLVPLVPIGLSDLTVTFLARLPT